jgi:DNA helicase-2/ATP-dependent DNA helicase PcrA
MNVNESQYRAITHKEGPMLVLAGPGSGKTLTITSRTKYLIEEYGIQPERILVITFTKAAAMEMKERFFRMMEGQRPNVTFGTFHAVYFTILKYAYGLRAENILRDEQRIDFLRELIHRYEMEVEDENDYISELTSEISKVKSEKIDLGNYYSVNCPADIFRKIYLGYDAKLKHARLIDFDDMLLMCNDLLRQREDVRKFWQARYTYILIDEFQDINKVQYDNIRILAEPENNLFIVGDDDQSIYRFRGAKPEIMLGFEQDYQNAQRVVLDYNYRSTRNIVEAAGLVIKNNTKRFEKDIKTIHEDGEKIKVKHFKTQKQEVEAVIADILQEKQQGRALEEIAVLFRTNTQPRLLAQKMVEYNIPFRMRDEVPNLYNHWIAKNVFTYIRMATGEVLRSDFLQVMNRPKRYISRDSLETEVVDFDKLKSYYQDKSWMIERLERFQYDLAMLKNMAPYAAIRYIQNAVGYGDYLKEYSEYRRMSLAELTDVLDEMAEGAKGL